MRGPVARETARRFIICKSRQIGAGEREVFQKGKKFWETWESKLAEKLYDGESQSLQGFVLRGEWKQ